MQPQNGGAAAARSHVRAHTCAQPMATMACSGAVSVPLPPKASRDVPGSPLQHLWVLLCALPLCAEGHPGLMPPRGAPG